MQRGSSLALVAMLCSTPALPAGADATFRVLLDAVASAVQDAQLPVTDSRHLDTGLVPIGPLPDSLAATLSADATYAETWGTAITSSQLELNVPGPFVGAVLRGTALAVGFGFLGTASPGTGQGYGRTEAVYTDSLTPSGLPYGTPVSLRVRIQLEGVMDRSDIQFSSNFAQLTFDLAGAPTSPVDPLSCINLEGACTQFDVGTMVLPSGVPQAFSLDLITETSANSIGLLESIVLGSSDFDSTAHLCIDATTAGATYVLQSGGDLRCFPMSVSVPALPPFALGALAVAFGLAGRRALRLKR